MADVGEADEMADMAGWDAGSASDEDASDEDAPPQTAQKRPAAAAFARRVPTAASTDYGDYSVTVQSQPQSQEPWLVYMYVRGGYLCMVYRRAL